MKKVIIMVVMVIMALAMVSCKSENKTETRKEQTARIMTSYTQSWSTEYNGEPSTTFRFNTREEATEFMYYWLDYGYTVSGVIEYTTTPRYYTVEIMEPEFNDVIRELRRAL